nr:MAG TPA: hypothetical protein [Bacteriophage sp.]
MPVKNHRKFVKHFDCLVMKRILVISNLRPVVIQSGIFWVMHWQLYRVGR